MDSFKDIVLPITDQFLLILLIILFAPLLLNKIRIPHLLGLIIAGAVIGAHGFNLIERDSVILFSTAGLLYIMFLAGLEMDIEDFKKNSKKSLIFGLYTFAIPLVLGVLSGMYLLNFSFETSLLMACMFSSHTLLTYPIVSKYGLAKNRAVNVTVGGTMITDTLALLVMAVIVANQGGEMDSEFWAKLSGKVVLFVAIVVLLFPVVARWFFKIVHDNVSQYVFVLAMVFLGAFLAEMAQLEGIIGAFLAGLTLNRLIPPTSPLMNRVEFVGNAIFIPFFLISVGMLIDYRAFFSDWQTVKVSAVITGGALIGKYLAAWATQKTFGFTVDERRLIFGLNPHAAATLAIVLVGLRIGLFDASVLNGTIVMILVTCTVASFFTQKGAKNIAQEEAAEKKPIVNEGRILISINRPDATENLFDLSNTIKSKKDKSKLYALNIIDSAGSKNYESNDSREAKAKQIIERAEMAASATDHEIETHIRYDINIVNALMGVVREYKITDLILGLHRQKGFSQSFLGNLTDGILNKCNTTTMIYKYTQPLATIKRHLILVPDKAEEEIGFPFWLMRVWNIARNTGAKLIFYTTNQTMEAIRELQTSRPVDFGFVEYSDWSDARFIAKAVRSDDNLIFVLSRKERPSYNKLMEKTPISLNKHFQENSFILIFPMQEGVEYEPNIDLTNPFLLEVEGFGKFFSRIFKKK